MTTPDQAPKPKWLKRIQENSWEPELLISGGAFFTLFTLSDNFIYWFRDIRIFLGLNIPGTEVVVFLIIAALEGITLLFLFHLLVRAYWTGMVGISYVYPHGIKFSGTRSVYPKFLYALRDGQNLTMYIEKIERTASLVFGITIRFVMSSMGVAFLLTVFAISLVYLPMWLTVPFFTGLVILLLFYMYDIVSDMKIRKSEKLAPLYYPFYRFLDLITLSFLFRPVTQVLLSNLTPKTIVPIALLILSLSFFSAYNTVNSARLAKPFYAGKIYENLKDETGAYLPYFYLNQWKEGDYKPSFQVGRDVIAEYNTQLIFIEYLPEYDDELYLLANPGNRPTEELFRSSFKIFIDDREFSTTVLVFGKNPKTSRLGLIGYYSLGDLSAGKHFLNVYAFKRDKATNSGKWEPLFLQIPFWKE